MRTAILAFAVLLTACTTPRPQPIAPRIISAAEASQMSIAELCLGVSTFRRVNAQTAAAELDSRGVDCRDHAQAVNNLQQQQAQEDAAALGMIMQNMNRPAPIYQPYQIPPPASNPQTTCTTKRIGWELVTTCK